jgi:radical SAM protein with 4Fe4S-binding SPASM domain
MMSDTTAGRLPVELMLEPTSKCNLRCPLCISGRGEIVRKPDLSYEAFQLIYDQFTNGCESLTFHNFGEPLLNKELPKMVAYAKKNGTGFTFLSTNATLIDDWWARQLTECGLDQIFVAVDGLTQETYEIYRIGGKLSRVRDNIRRLIEAADVNRSRLEIVLQFIVFKHNEHELSELYEWALELGVHKLCVKISGSAARYDEFRPADEAFVAINQTGPEGPLCNWVYRTLVVNCDGEVMPCCWAGHDANYSMGNVFRTSVADIWNSEKYSTLRSAVGSRKNLWSLCEQKCLFGAKSRRKIFNVAPRYSDPIPAQVVRGPSEYF